MSSLRARLLWYTGVGGSLLLLLAGVAIFAMFQSSLLRAFDTDLRQRTLTLAKLIENENGDAELEFEDAELPEFSRKNDPDYYELRDAGGVVIAASASLAADQTLGSAGIGDPDGHVRAITLPDGRAGRCCVLRFKPRLDEATFLKPEEIPLLELAVARDTRDVAVALRGLGAVLGVVGGATLLLGLIGLAAMIRAGLRPAARVADAIAAVDAAQLSARVDAATTPDELRPIVARLNDLLARLEQAFSREKGLTSDIAHELRNPLAGMISTIEVALARPRESAEYRGALQNCLSMARGTARLVESLLTLARLDAEAARRAKTAVGAVAQPDVAPAERVDLAAMLRQEWTSVSAYGAQSPRVRWQVPDSLTAQGDPARLRILLRNLLDNAARYSADGTEVSIVGQRDNGDVRFEISNLAPTDSAVDPTRVFERFYRGDAARAGDGGNVGIGLALCKAIVASLGGEIGARMAADRRFTIDCRLPADA